jgi:hypothetical protein
MEATSPGSKVMTGFSAKVRPEFAEKRNMTLNKGRDHRRSHGYTAADRGNTHAREPN